MKTKEKRLENQYKHQRRVIFNEYNDDTPFQWNGEIEHITYRKYELAGYDGIKVIWEESIRSELRFNENSMVVECLRYNNGEQCSKRLDIYDGFGRLVVSQIFDEIGNKVQESNYTYATNKKLINYTVQCPDRNNKYVYIYDPDGRLVQKTSYKDSVINKVTSYLYNDNGYIAAYCELYPDGEIGLIMSYIYHKNGNIKSSMYVFDDERTYTQYKYDSEGKIIRTESEMYNVETCNDFAVMTEEWEYDENGNVIGIIERNGDQIISRSEWTIKYRK